MSKTLRRLKCVPAVALVSALAVLVFASSEKPSTAVGANNKTAMVIGLELVFPDGGKAVVHQREGGFVTIQQGDKKVSFTLIAADRLSGAVELKFNEQQTLLVDKQIAAVSGTALPFAVRAIDTRFKPIAQTPLPGPGECCARDCSGRLICAECVCTPCESCGFTCLCPQPGVPVI